MFTLQDGREHLYQWDLDRYIIVEDKTICEVHFCNRTSDCSLVVEVKDGLAPIPNILLQEARPIRVYAYVDDKYTLTEEQFTVKSRTRPDDYVYTETDVITVRDMIDRADKTLEQTSEALANSETALANATAANNTANETIALAQEAVVDMDKLVADAAQSAYDANEAAKRAENAADYYTKEETTQAIAAAQEVFYFDFSSILSQGMKLTATEEQASAIERIFNGEPLSILIKTATSSYDYVPVEVRVQGETVQLQAHYFNNDNTAITNYRYRAVKSNGVWTITRVEYNSFDYTTPDTVQTMIDESVEAIEIPTKVSELENDSEYVTEKTASSRHSEIRDAVADLTLTLLGTTIQVGGWDRFPIYSLNKITSAYSHFKTSPLLKWTGSRTYFRATDFGGSVTEWFNVDTNGNKTDGDRYLYTNHIYVFSGAQMFDIESEEAFRLLITNALTYDNTASGLTATTITGAIDELAARPIGGGGEGANVDLSNYYTKAQTDKAISDAVDAIDIPEVDFTGYATEQFVNEAVAAIEVPSDEHINSLINDALGVIENGSY